MLAVVNRTFLRFIVKFLVSLPFIFLLRSRKQKANTLVLSPSEKSILNDLDLQGYAYLGDFCSGPMMEQLLSESGLKMQSAERNGIKQANERKDFWLRLLDEDMMSDRWTTENPFVAMALNESILKIISKYFGEIPYLNSILLSLSKPALDGYKQSQLWHQDRDDTGVVKFFIYLTDVPNLDYGPFTLFDKNTSKKIKNSFVPRHMTDEQVGHELIKNKSKAFFAPKCSAFLVDTGRCYHMGSRVGEGKSRLLYTASFTTSPPIYPNFDNHIKLGRSAITDIQKEVIKYIYA